MTTFLESSVSEMTADLLVEGGESFTYTRGFTDATVTLRRSTLPSQLMESGDGMITEVRPVDFIGLTSALPYDPPARGDRITDGTRTWEVVPTTSEKVFRRITKTMTRIHAQEIAT